MSDPQRHQTPSRGTLPTLEEDDGERNAGGSFSSPPPLPPPLPVGRSNSNNNNNNNNNNGNFRAISGSSTASNDSGSSLPPIRPRSPPPPAFRMAALRPRSASRSPPPSSAANAARAARSPAPVAPAAAATTTTKSTPVPSSSPSSGKMHDDARPQKSGPSARSSEDDDDTNIDTAAGDDAVAAAGDAVAGSTTASSFRTSTYPNVYTGSDGKTPMEDEQQRMAVASLPRSCSHEPSYPANPTTRQPQQQSHKAAAQQSSPHLSAATDRGSNNSATAAASVASRAFSRHHRRSLSGNMTAPGGASLGGSSKSSGSPPLPPHSAGGLYGSVHTSPGGTTSSGGGGAAAQGGTTLAGFGSNISRKSVLIRNALARRSTATLSRLSNRNYYPSGGGFGTSSNHYVNSNSSEDGDAATFGMAAAAGLAADGSGTTTTRTAAAAAADDNLPRTQQRVYRGYSVGDWTLINAGSPCLDPVVDGGGNTIPSHSITTTSPSPSPGGVTTNAAPLPPATAVVQSTNRPSPPGTPFLANRFGYPRGEGSTTEEQRGPYQYVLARVRAIHYEENAVFYSVTRQDNDADVRGDAECMEPIQTPEGLDAARRAASHAHGTNTDCEDDDGMGENRNIPEENHYILQFLGTFLVVLLLPFLWIYDLFVFVIGARLYQWGTVVFIRARNQANLFLNGLHPYECSARVTTVNLIVLCSTWYMFIDQMRLAFFPRSADNILAVINFTIWTVLTSELLFEVFIRPEGYYRLLRSEKAFTPATVRFISGLHLIVESVSLVFFAPEFWCLFDDDLTCDGRPKFSFLNSSLLAVAGADRWKALAGRAFYACIRLRIFGMIRHWRNMWINKTFLKRTPQRAMRFVNDRKSVNTSDRSERRSPDGSPDGHGDSMTGNRGYPAARVSKLERKKRDAAVINASNIGTALMTTNSNRALIMFCLILGIFPMITLIFFRGVVNPMGQDMVNLLQGTNLQVDVENATSCKYLVDSVGIWVESFIPRDLPCITTPTDSFLLSVAIQPSRCVGYFENLTVGGMIFSEGVCPPFGGDGTATAPCIVGALRSIYGADSIESAAQVLDIRAGNILTDTAGPVDGLDANYNFTAQDALFGVSASCNYTYSTECSALFSFVLQVCLLVTVLVGLVVLRHDAEHLVLRPLRSMLKIVARYAKNPLAQATLSGKDYTGVGSESESSFSMDDDDDGDDASEADGFGTYETEQLITAVSKITDLLRKCWGVAGADIISTNLASREGELAEVFNPTVPGKSVYALFAFVAINGFDHALKCLGGDVMILINDVAAVLHGEVFRWGFGDSGQCNKNLGAAFLMVFRIGLVKEVVEKLEEATRVVFSTSDIKKVSVKKRPRDKLPHHLRKASSDTSSAFDRFDRLKTTSHGISRLNSNLSAKQHDAMADAMQLSLQSLPGISTFTDRAVIGMLKSFAGIHRDNRLRTWSRDFRLSAGVGAWSVNMIFGMDAGWAVEGAVGSEYKIDATYLSPHVNMASRMMSACKHYGVTILLSEAVQELMSDQAKCKLRNLDRVTVKGSTQVQNIYTYDARHKGADFFLYSRSDEQADLEAERYQPNMWFYDQDLKAMRHHVTEDFEQEFLAGLKDYYDGNWPSAIEKLEGANEIMVDAALEEGYLHDEMDDSPDRKELYRTETADGPCKYLLTFMKSKGGKAPEGWAGWHPLLSK